MFDTSTPRRRVWLSRAPGLLLAACLLGVACGGGGSGTGSLTGPFASIENLPRYHHAS